MKAEKDKLESATQTKNAKTETRPIQIRGLIFLQTAPQKYRVSGSARIFLPLPTWFSPFSRCFSPQGGKVSFLVSNKIVMLLLWSPITTAGIHRKRHRVVHAPIFFLSGCSFFFQRRTTPHRNEEEDTFRLTQIYIAFRINTETNMKYKSDD